MKDIYIRTDKNGTKYYHNYTCRRCGGAGGADQWKATGWTCYECGGSGVASSPEVIKVYTPEYEAVLAERRAKRAEKKSAERRAKAEELNGRQDLRRPRKHLPGQGHAEGTRMQMDEPLWLDEFPTA